MRSDTPTVLKRICDRKLEEIAERKALTDVAVLKDRALAPTHPEVYSGTRIAPRAGCTWRHAEVKKASPSKGVIRADFDPASIAASYENGGAACLLSHRY